MLRLDHVAVSAERLEDGAAAVQAALGVPMTGGGTHPAMGTHNRLLSLGDLYLEVIAIDPEAPAPDRPRWFDLDRFSGPPRLTNWIVACDDMEAALRHGPPGWGLPMQLARGDYRWQMAVPESGRLPFDNFFPALIRWQGMLHPAPALPDHGLRLARLEVSHPDARALRAALPTLTDPRVAIGVGPPALRAVIDTPNGPRTLT
ncbi:VOC family protein [Tabrizicola caldifontis]|uniref:VOC family protein n=1 Tax=Tabrizicola caldifontis TaxID=2528036 RepID=UPI001082285D|nr:VOC family protein [Rhodobacter sp. YIM 73028]